LTTLSLLAIMLPVMFSCLKEMPESGEDLPQSLQWNPDLAFPLGFDSFGLNAESGFDTTLWELDTLFPHLPLWVDEVSVEMTGRVPFDLASLSQDIDHINEVLFRLNLYNGFPHEVLAQAYFVDINENLIDSMFATGRIPVNPGGIVGDGETIDPAVLRKDVVFDHDRLEPLEQATEIILSALITDHSENIDTAMIDYYRNYHFDVDIGVMVSITLDYQTQ